MDKKIMMSLLVIVAIPTMAIAGIYGVYALFNLKLIHAGVSAVVVLLAVVAYRYATQSED